MSHHKKKRNCTIQIAKTKVLISFAVTAKLICVFVFAYADCWFSHEVNHMTSFYICVIDIEAGVKKRNDSAGLATIG